jgi:hypothetical protein
MHDPIPCTHVSVRTKLSTKSPAYIVNVSIANKSKITPVLIKKDMMFFSIIVLRQIILSCTKFNLYEKQVPILTVSNKYC